MERTYLYAITDNAKDTALDPVKAQALVGLDGRSPVSLVRGGGLSCVVGGYQGPPLETLPREAMVRQLLAHQRVVERVMEHATVLPVRFGTTLGGPDEVRVLLAQNRPALIEALAAVRDVVELDVAATWDKDRVLREISQEPAVAQAREALLVQGQPSMEDRVRLGQLVKEAMDRRRERYRSLMVEHLSPLALDTASNALVSDELVMNVAFLVARSRQEAFDEAVHALDQRFGGEITFRVIGPLPAYSFRTVEVGYCTPEQREEARRTLGLPGDFSKEAVRQAYRRRAAEVQAQFRRRPEPVEGGDQETTADALAHLRQAAALLTNHDRARDAEAGTLFTVAFRRSEDRDVAASRFSVALPGGR